MEIACEREIERETKRLCVERKIKVEDEVSELCSGMVSDKGQSTDRLTQSRAELGLWPYQIPIPPS